MRISDWSSDVCSSDLRCTRFAHRPQMARKQNNRRITFEIDAGVAAIGDGGVDRMQRRADRDQRAGIESLTVAEGEIIIHESLRVSSGSAAHTSVPPLLTFSPLMLRRSEEHTSELQSLMRISYAVFCL